MIRNNTSHEAVDNIGKVGLETLSVEVKKVLQQDAIGEAEAHSELANISYIAVAEPIKDVLSKKRIIRRISEKGQNGAATWYADSTHFTEKSRKLRILPRQNTLETPLAGLLSTFFFQHHYKQTAKSGHSKANQIGFSRLLGLVCLERAKDLHSWIEVIQP